MTRSAQPLRLLVLDDCEDDALLVCQELQRYGFALSWERVDTREAMASALDRESWDLIVSDFRMPGFDAPEALALYHERQLDLPFIIVSGTVDEEQAVASLKAGAHDFVSKGRVARLGPAVERTLRDAQERRARREVEAAHAQAVERLRESEARYRQVVESIEEVIFAGRTGDVGTAHHHIVLASPQVETLTGRTAQEFQDHPRLWSSLVHPEDYAAARQASADAFNTRTSVQRRYRLWNCVRDEYRCIEDTFTPEVDPAGRVVGFFGVARDVTEQRRVEDQLHQAQKMEAVGQLVGGIAHDFNNLLGIIAGYGELLVRHLPVDHPAYRHGREIQSVVERAAALPQQLLAFTRKRSLERRVLSLNAVVSDTERMLRRVIGEDIQLITVLGENTGTMRADTGQISQVIVNLAINARDAMPDGGQLTLETAVVEVIGPVTRWPAAAPGRYVMLSVRDTGTGMDETTRARVFEPFFTTKGPGKGTGFGLANVHSIVTAHGGYVAVESVPTKGTTFRVLFPCADGSAEAPVAPRATPPLTGGSERILLVEDEATLRLVIGELLGVAGYTVIEADSPEAAIAAAEKDPTIDLLVTDMVLPRMSGKAVADAIRALRPRVKALFVSGYPGEAVGADGTPIGILHFLQKPFSMDALLAKIREVLDRPE